LGGSAALRDGGYLKTTVSGPVQIGFGLEPSISIGDIAGEDDEMARRFGWCPNRSTVEGVRAAGLENFSIQIGDLALFAGLPLSVLLPRLIKRTVRPRTAPKLTERLNGYPMHRRVILACDRGGWRII